MNKKDLIKAHSIIDNLFYEEKAITQWQHRLLEGVIDTVQLLKHQVKHNKKSNQSKLNMERFLELEKQHGQ